MSHKLKRRTIIASFVVLIPTFLLFAILKLPQFQTSIARWIPGYLSFEWQTEVFVESFYLDWGLDMHLEAVSVLSWFTNPSEHSTHLSASSINSLRPSHPPGNDCANCDFICSNIIIIIGLSPFSISSNADNIDVRIVSSCASIFDGSFIISLNCGDDNNDENCSMDC